MKGMVIDLVPLINQTLNNKSEAILTPISHPIRGTEH